MKTKHRQAAQVKRRWQADPFAWQRALQMVKPPAVEEQIKVIQIFKPAYDRLCSGKGDVQDFNTINSAVQYAISGCAYLPTIEDAQANIRNLEPAVEAMRRMRQRHEDGKGLVFDGPGMRDVQGALDIHYDLLERLSKNHLLAAMQDAEKRIKGGRCKIAWQGKNL